MSDSLRTDSQRPPGGAPDADRDAKIEQLLLVGLDHYFSAQYEQAINVWTRALFLDRSHARARAYIERARTAQAERQRETDELLQSGIAAFERGEGVEARRLIQTALGRGAPADEALAVLDRLDRLEYSAAPVANTDLIVPVRSRRTVRGAGAPRRSVFRTLAVALVVLGIVAGGYAWAESRWPNMRSFASSDVLDVLGLLGPAAAAPAPSPESPEAELALPRRGRGRSFARAKPAGQRTSSRCPHRA